jgi:hypothetical protein
MTLNHYHFETLENIGRVLMWATMRGVAIHKHPRPEILKGLTNSSRTDEATAQKVMQYRLNLPEKLRTEHINAAACVAVYVMTREKLAEAVAKT